MVRVRVPPLSQIYRLPDFLVTVDEQFRVARCDERVPVWIALSLARVSFALGQALVLFLPDDHIRGSTFDGQEDTGIETRLQAFVHQAKEYANRMGYNKPKEWN